MAGKPEQEPSIEEILASIRQIISDDDQPQESGLDLSANAEEKFVIPVAAPVASPPAKHDIDDDDILELTNEIPEQKQAAAGIVDIGYSEDDNSEMEAEAELEPEPIIPPAPEKEESLQQEDMTLNTDDNNFSVDVNDSIFTETAASATTNAFSKLVGNIPVEREDRSSASTGGVTLEDITRDLLRPILRDWINENVPAIVERLVEKELEKLARQARDD